MRSIGAEDILRNTSLVDSSNTWYKYKGAMGASPVTT